MNRSLRVGFVGLGSQGAPMASMIARAGWPLTVWARRPQALESLSDPPVAVAPGLAELAESSDLLCLCVGNDSDVDEVMGLAVPNLAPGSVTAIHSTVLPETCHRWSIAAGERGIEVIDAPVMGGSRAALAGELAVCVGGNPAAFRRSQPVFESYGNPVSWVGPLGSGQVMKLMYNLFFAAEFELAVRVSATAESLGLRRSDVALFIAQIRKSRMAASLVAGDVTPEAAAHAGNILEKDVGHASSILPEKGVSSLALVQDLAWGGLATLGRISGVVDPLGDPGSWESPH
jgi:3-hydroxyisobutyrate dehydrogenase